MGIEHLGVLASVLGLPPPSRFPVPTVDMDRGDGCRSRLGFGAAASPRRSGEAVSGVSTESVAVSSCTQLQLRSESHNGLGQFIHGVIAKRDYDVRS